LLLAYIYKIVSCQLLAGLIVLLFSMPSMAASPLATGDTGMLGPGGWEFTAFVAGEKRDSIESYNAPAVEVVYGSSANTTIAVAAARQVLDEPDAGSRSGWGYASAEIKWRFFNSDGKALAFAPSYSHPLSHSATIRGLIEDISILRLPLIASIERGDWILTGQVAYDITSDSFNGIGYGVWTGYSWTDSMLLLAEIYGEEISGDNGTGGATNWRLGFEYGIGDSAAILFSGGSRLRSDLPHAEKLDSEFFLGFRWETN
jgi:hypothetical protein